jgi:hypothetical protein
VADVNALIRRRDTLRDQQSVTRSTWQDLGDYILPRKSNIITTRSPGSKMMQRVMDSTPIRANELLASSMQGALTSAAVRWFRLKLRDKQLNDVPEVAAWLEACADTIYLAFTQSNLAAELQEVYLDLGAFGIGALMEEEHDPSARRFSGFLFQSMQVGTYVVAEGPDGRVNTVFRDVPMSVQSAADKFGVARLGESLKKKLERNPDEFITVTHAVYPRGTYGKTTRLKPFASCWFYAEGKHLLREGGYDSFPCMVPRWTKTSGEVYGRGPGHTALPDVRTLNKARELTLKAWAKAVDPPMKQRTDGVIGSVKLMAGGLNTLVNMDDLAPLESKARFDVGNIEEEQLRTSIREIFYNNQLQLPNKVIMTATEVERVYELMQRVLGPTLGRLESELLAPLIERSFALLADRQELPPLPAELGDDANIDIEYEGPLARAQRASDTQAIERTLAVAIPIAQLDPDALDVIDMTAVVRITAQKQGAPSAIIRSEQAVAERRAQRQQEREQMKQQAQMESFATMAGKAAPLVKSMPPEMLAGMAGEVAPA